MSTTKKPTGGRKAMAKKQTHVDVEAIITMKDKINEIEEIPDCEKDDEELGIDKLNMVMPDTWNNISWVIKNAVTHLVERS